MIVSQNRAAFPISLLATGPRTGSPTPFWELEELIALGFDRNVALKVMSVRRCEHPVMPMPDVISQLTLPRHRRALLSSR